MLVRHTVHSLVYSLPCIFAATLQLNKGVADRAFYREENRLGMVRDSPKVTRPVKGRARVCIQLGLFWSLCS